MAMKIQLYREQTKKEQEERGVPELADGKYHIEIEDVEQRTRGQENPQPCIMVRLKVLDGPSAGPAWDWWMLPTGDMTDGQRSFWEGHWYRVARALPGLFDEGAQSFEPSVLKGARGRMTVVHEAYKARDGSDGEAQRFRSWRIESRAAGAPAAVAASPSVPAAAAVPSAKPQKFATP